MRKIVHPAGAAFNYVLRITAQLIILAAALTLGIEAQATTNVTDNFTPSGVAPGSPAGSYVLSGFDTVNPYNGNLNFRLPLLRIGGRGTASYTMTLKVDLRWTVDHDYDSYGAPINTPTINWWVWPEVGYGPGLLQGRQQIGEQCSLDDPYVTQTDTLTRLTFISSDGTEFELRDQLWGGQPKLSQCYTNGQQNFYGVSRGRVFVTADGTSATFISDEEIKDVVVDYGGVFAPTGTLYMRDGMRYRIQTGSVMSITDRNGNRIAFTYDTSGRVKTIVDPVGRQVTVDYEVQDSAPYGLCDQIKFSGFNGAQRVIRISKANLSSALRPDSSLRTVAQLFPNLNGSSSTYLDPRVTSAVWLPDGTKKYQLYYNSYSELAKVVLPTGGVFEYDWAGGDVSGTEVFRYVTERRVYTSPSTLEGRTVYTSTSDLTNNDPKQFVEESQYSPNNTLVSKTKHYYYGSPTSSLFPPYQFNYTGWREGREYKTEQFAADGVTVISSEEHTWEQRAPVTWWWGTSGNAPSNDPRIAETKTTLVDTGQVTKQTFAYDQYNNVTDTYDYDFGAAGSGVAGALLRRTHTDYVTAASYVKADANPALGASLRSLPTQQWVSTDIGGANKASLTTYGYDQYGLFDCPGIVGHDAAYTTGFATRGNVTSVTRYADAAGGTGAITTTAQYDIAGNAVSTTDGRGNTSSASYADSFSDGIQRNTYAFPTGTASAVPDPTGQYGSATALTTSSVYDFSTGQVTSATDANGKTATFDYTDPLDRLKLVTRPDGGTTSYFYDQSMNAGVMNDYVRTTTALDASNSVVSYQFFDGLGRPNRSFLHEGGSPAVFLTTDQQYDALGRAFRVSNPYRTNGSGDAINPSNRWTTTAYDTLGRVTSVTTPDGAAVTTSYTGNTVTVTDQAGKQRRSVSDAIGRLSQVIEDPAGLAYATTYTHDVLGNLRRVDQGGQVRFFMYDSLSRLIRAKNPEQAAGSVASNMTDPVTGNSQWSMAYGYDNNGNLTARVDARNVTTTYGYDALNRNTTVRYTDGTKDIDRHYDGAINGRGRFYYFNWDPSNNTRFDTHLAIDQYDAMGRPLKYRQHFLTNGSPSPQFLVTRSYDYAGHVTSQTYPSGHTVSYSYDVAGRVNGFSGNLGDGVSRTYSTGVSYSEFGGITQEQFGTLTPLYHKLHYNVRGQLYDVRLSTLSLQASEFDWNRGCLAFYYGYNWGESGPANNGNMTLEQHFVPADDSYTNYWYTQDAFGYDSLNRIASASEVHGGPGWQSGQDFAQAYYYDRFGNRTINASGTWNAPAPQFTADAGTNRLSPPAGYTMQYDGAGNLTFDNYTGNGTRAYDAENRMTAAQDGYGGTSTYTYDADGRRVKRNSAGQETWQVYGPGGELLAEYQAGMAPFLATKEYGYRGGELLVTMASGDPQRMTRFIKNLYYNCLARDPNSTELQQKTDQLAQAGVQGEPQLLTTARSIARGLFESSEYAARGRSDAEYVTDLYNAYLQRAPDTSGLNFWVQDVQNNGRGHTLTAFEVSTEFATMAETVYGTASGGDNQRVDHFIDEFYLGAYNRFPDSTEKQQQEQRLNNAAAVSQSQVVTEARNMGAEIFQATNYNSSHTDSQYVTDLYEAFLQRAPDGPGLSVWLQDVQNNGRAHTLNAFQLSIEFGQLAGTLYRETFWLVPDHLGTPRMVVYKTGSLAGVKRHDYLPFGEELNAGVGGRTTTQGYSASDNVRQKFTDKERDAETGLDYFEARYYSSTMGRFTSPDEFAGGPDELYDFVGDASANPTFYADLRNPQSLNKYQYGYNNPLRYVDPDGHDPNDDQEQSKNIPGVPAPPYVPPGDPFQALQQAYEEIDDWTQRNIREWGPIKALRQALGKAPDVSPNDVPAPAMPQTGAPPSGQTQPLPPPPPMQARKQSVRTATRTPGGVTPGRNISDKQAQERLRRGGDIIAPSRAKAKELQKKASGGAVHDRPHRPGYRPHFHGKDRKGGHAFY